MGNESRKIAEKKFDVHQVNKVILGKMNLCNEYSCKEVCGHDKASYLIA